MALLFNSATVTSTEEQSATQLDGYVVMTSVVDIS